MPCSLDPNKKCDKTKSKDGYTKKELQDIAKECNIKAIYKYSKEELCKLIEKAKGPATTAVAAADTSTKTASKEAKKTIEKKTNDTSACVKNIIKMCNLTEASQIDELISVLNTHKNMLYPKNITNIKTPNKAKTSSNLVKEDASKNTDDLFTIFAKFFEEELMGFTKRKDEVPKMRAFVPGGFGLKMLMEHKYGEMNKINTGDLDITISVNKSALTHQEATAHLVKKCQDFINSRPDAHLFKIQKITFQPSYNPLLKMVRYCVVSIYYKNDEFVDLCITDREINISDIDVVTSKKCHLPIKKDEGYLFEYFQMIYMENVPGVDHYCYLKRNPVTGKFSCKGSKDIDRVSLLCSVSNNQKYKKYCTLVKNITIEKLKTMPKHKRDKYFNEIRNII